VKGHQAIVELHSLATARNGMRFDNFGRWIDEDLYQPCVDERIFVNTLLQSHPDFAQIHLCSDNALRVGLTLLQLSAPLDTGPELAN
jgi:hypothetical protein